MGKPTFGKFLVTSPLWPIYLENISFKTLLMGHKKENGLKGSIITPLLPQTGEVIDLADILRHQC